MKKTAAPCPRAVLNTSIVGPMTVERAERSQARQPHGPCGSSVHEPSMTRPKSLARMASQVDKAVSSMSNTTAGRSVRGASSSIQATAGAVASCRSVR
jgi:hypothetical protein